MLASLTELVSASPWTYAAIVALVTLDALLPLLPSETALISAGVLASSGDLTLVLVVAAGAAGALVGDNGAYSLGRLLGKRLADRIARSERATRRRDWAEQKLDSGGISLFLVARFVPGGRTAATLTSGLVRYRWRRFLLASALGSVLWASAATLVGYACGHAFQEHPYLLIALALGAAGAYLTIKRIPPPGAVPVTHW